ncbi:MAG: NDP-sugar synthase, partial [Thermoleophilia bacterium]|nr:NDP-sugar synthase [Thermoleophilia bacterium]
MHAIILVGGRGTRLQPLTDTRPNPMLPFLGVQFLELQILYLQGHGVEEITLACGVLPDEIRAYFGDGEGVDLPINYAVEPEPLDTAGAIAFAARAF